MTEKLMLIEYDLDGKTPAYIETDENAYWLEISRPPKDTLDERQEPTCFLEQEYGLSFNGTHSPNRYVDKKPRKLWVRGGKIEFVEWDKDTRSYSKKVLPEDSGWIVIEEMIGPVDEDGFSIETLDQIVYRYEAVECDRTVGCNVCETIYDDEDLCDHLILYEGDVHGPGAMYDENDEERTKEDFLSFIGVIEKLSPGCTPHLLAALKSGKWGVCISSDMFSQSIYSDFEGLQDFGDVLETALEDHREASYCGFGYLWALQKPKVYEQPYLDLAIQWLASAITTKHTNIA